MLGPQLQYQSVFITICIYNLVRTKYHVTNYADDTKLGGVGNSENSKLNITLKNVRSSSSLHKAKKQSIFLNGIVDVQSLGVLVKL